MRDRTRIKGHLLTTRPCGRRDCNGYLARFSSRCEYIVLIHRPMNGLCQNRPAGGFLPNRQSRPSSSSSPPKRDRMIHGHRHHLYLCRHFSWCGSAVIDCPLCPATHHHCLHCAWCGAGPLRLGRGIRHGTGVWRRPRRHYFSPVSTRARYETDRPVEQSAPINSGRPDQRGSVCCSRLWFEPTVWVQWNGCSAD